MLVRPGPESRKAGSKNVTPKGGVASDRGASRHPMGSVVPPLSGAPDLLVAPPGVRPGACTPVQSTPMPLADR